MVDFKKILENNCYITNDSITREFEDESVHSSTSSVIEAMKQVWNLAIDECIDKVRADVVYNHRDSPFVEINEESLKKLKI